MEEAIRLAAEGMQHDQGGPFGAVVVKEGKIIGKGCNQVTSQNDPTAHAEMVAIREACHHLGSFQLNGCELYTSCEPCPMCLGAIYWARLDRVYYAGTRQDAARHGFDDALIYEEIELAPSERLISFTQLDQEKALEVFRAWTAKEDRKEY
ncbi:tRNA(Arg) A34 adenosine deaminase TadA [Catalinimonas alkaloidigena]|uniref:tRNA(Arg) A34 adenosine deaminase TadA n=2 Tax=Catalinimonas alkaloidigena TaxID=1075417 RepID=A0A1G8ZKL3_9BACT|nr:tRNA(Arg) A34 adenosine deaminase TadA [Catalinimonas alkaloidigena]